MKRLIVAAAATPTPAPHARIRRRMRVRANCLAMIAATSVLASTTTLADTYRVTTTRDTLDGQCDGDCSLFEAIIAANTRSGPDTVIVPGGTYVLTRAGADEDEAATGDLDILDDLTITGVGPARTYLAGNKIDRAIDIHGPVAVRMSGLAVVTGQITAEPNSRGGDLSDVVATWRRWATTVGHC